MIASSAVSNISHSHFWCIVPSKKLLMYRLQLCIKDQVITVLTDTDRSIKWSSPNTDEYTIQPMLLCKIIEALFSHNAFTSFKVLTLKKRFKPLPDLLTLRKSSEQKQCYQFSSHCIQSSNTSDVWRYELWYCYQKPCSRIPLLCINIWVPQLQCHWICKGNRV